MLKTAFICSTCGVQFAESEQPPVRCKICEDERQYVNVNGQSWTTLPQINSKHKNIIDKVAYGLYTIYSTPNFAIGQRAHLLKTQYGNILWDCITNLDDSTVDLIENLGGIDAIAISHPHYYSTIAEWSRRFGDVPVYIHARDEKWLGRADFNLVLWNEVEKEIWPDVKLINCAGHFDGGCVLHYNFEDGLLLAGDIIQVSMDQKSVSMMYSYPNLIPLSKRKVLHIQESLKGLNYEAIYGAFGNYIRKDGEAIVRFSVERYLKIFE